MAEGTCQEDSQATADLVLCRLQSHLQAISIHHKVLVTSLHSTDRLAVTMSTLHLIHQRSVAEEFFVVYSVTDDRNMRESASSAEQDS